MVKGTEGTWLLSPRYTEPDVAEPVLGRAPAPTSGAGAPGAVVPRAPAQDTTIGR